MAKSYAEYLTEQGATADDVKVLDTPIARKAYDGLVKSAAESDRLAGIAKADYAQVWKWYETEALPFTAQMQKERNTALATAAAETARIKALQEQGLLEVAAGQGEPPVTPPLAAVAPAIDLTKYASREEFNELAVRAADSITLVADLAQEHAALGLPPISWRAAKVEAGAAHKGIEQFWMEKYNIQAKRDEKATADKAAYDKRIADEAVLKYRSEHGNPFTAPPVISRTPFTNAPASGTGTRPQPWAKSEGQASNERVNALLQKHPEFLQ